jgi:general stress protein YciG
MAEQERDEEGQFTSEEQNELEQDQGDSKSSSGRGFAGMSEEKRREIASMGGRAQGRENNKGNFANDKEKASAAGRIGGQNSRGGGQQKSDDTEE